MAQKNTTGDFTHRRSADILFDAQPHCPGADAS